MASEARDLRPDGAAVFEDGATSPPPSSGASSPTASCARGRPVPIEELAHRFYDIGHLVAIDRRTDQGKAEPSPNCTTASTCCRANRWWPPCAVSACPATATCTTPSGLSAESVIVLQREGTVEEIAGWLRDAGAEDGFILDNGGSGLLLDLVGQRHRRLSLPCPRFPRAVPPPCWRSCCAARSGGAAVGQPFLYGDVRDNERLPPASRGLNKHDVATRRDPATGS